MTSVLLRRTGPRSFKTFSQGREGGAGDSDNLEIDKVLIQVAFVGAAWQNSRTRYGQTLQVTVPTGREYHSEFNLSGTAER